MAFLTAKNLLKTSLIILFCCLAVLIQLQDNILEFLFGYAGYTLIDSDFGVPIWANLSNLQDFHVVNFEDLINVGLDENLPTLIKNSPVKEWEALKKWNPGYLTNIMPVLTKVKFTLADNDVFIYEDNDRMMRRWDDEKYKEYKAKNFKQPEHRASIDVAGLGTVTLSNAAEDAEKRIEFQGIGKRMLEFHNMSTADFFATNKTLQWNSVINSRLSSEVMPRDFMYVVDDPERTATAADFTANIWVSKVGAIAGMHYDPNHNMFAQVYGCKRFLLVSQQYWNKVKLHPLFHPSDRQSQLEFESAKVQLKAQVVDLYPGDLLYLPPYYFHRVSAIKCGETNSSMSVNVFSHSRAKELSDLVQNVEEIPVYFVEPGFFPNPNLNLLVGALGLYIRTLVSGITNRSVNEMIEYSIVQERYMAQNKLSASLGCEDFDVTKCPSILLNPEEFIKVNVTIAETVQRQAKEKAASFTASNLSQSILEIILADTIERIVTLVVSLEKTCSFLRCIAIEP